MSSRKNPHLPDELLLMITKEVRDLTTFKSLRECHSMFAKHCDPAVFHTINFDPLRNLSLDKLWAIVQSRQRAHIQIVVCRPIGPEQGDIDHRQSFHSRYVNPRLASSPFALIHAAFPHPSPESIHAALVQGRDTTGLELLELAGSGVPGHFKCKPRSLAALLSRLPCLQMLELETRRYDSEYARISVNVMFLSFLQILGSARLSHLRRAKIIFRRDEHPVGAWDFLPFTEEFRPMNLEHLHIQMGSDPRFFDQPVGAHYPIDPDWVMWLCPRLKHFIFTDRGHGLGNSLDLVSRIFDRTPGLVYHDWRLDSLSALSSRVTPPTLRSLALAGCLVDSAVLTSLPAENLGTTVTSLRLHQTTHSGKLSLLFSALAQSNTLIDVQFSAVGYCPGLPYYTMRCIAKDYDGVLFSRSWVDSHALRDLFFCVCRNRKEVEESTAAHTSADSSPHANAMRTVARHYVRNFCSVSDLYASEDSALVLRREHERLLASAAVSNA